MSGEYNDAIPLALPDQIKGIVEAADLPRRELEDAVFPEDSNRIDHFLGRRAIMNILYFRFANTFPDLEPQLRGQRPITSPRISARGAFYKPSSRWSRRPIGADDR